MMLLSISLVKCINYSSYINDEIPVMRSWKEGKAFWDGLVYMLTYYVCMGGL